MEDFENLNENSKQESEKNPWAKAMEIWNELFMVGAHLTPYNFEKDAWQPYLTVNYVTDDGKTGVEARLYQNNMNLNDFTLMANNGDVMAMLEMAKKLLERNINVVRIGQGNGIFRPGDNEILANNKLEELRKKFNC